MSESLIFSFCTRTPTNETQIDEDGFFYFLLFYYKTDEKKRSATRRRRKKQKKSEESEKRRDIEKKEKRSKKECVCVYELEIMKQKQILTKIDLLLFRWLFFRVFPQLFSCKRQLTLRDM